ncbi:MAG: DUF2165 domain-containing protein [Gordonia sp. (in: high G+C Gram-positive bacteria)]|uniref:DUF2165 domain-containing protein n=1 Tax=Gordonia sp. (in: high G+C Gram-positive bacteria) TaxID=84139 RepID=UPI0039E6A8FE
MTEPRTRVRWTFLGTLPFAAAVLVLINAVYITLVAIGNITDYDTNYEFVKGVLSMDTINFEDAAHAGQDLDPDVSWRAIHSPVLWNIGYILVIVWESLAGLVLLFASYKFARAFIKDEPFASARRWGSGGLLMIVALFAGGFIAIGGEWFQMWRSIVWNGEEAALRNALIALLGIVLIHIASPAWKKGHQGELSS